MTDSPTSNVPPKVFISYSHDSREHNDRVLELADRLRKDGIDCNIDQYQQSPAVGWHRWTMKEIDWSDFVLIICTSEYIRRFRANEEDGIRMGVIWKGAIVTQEIYTQKGKNKNFIPILFTSHNIDLIPNIFRSSTSYILNSSRNYELLYDYLTSQPEISKLKLGKLKTLPSRDRKQSFDVQPNIQEQEHCNLPRKNHGYFIGRSEEIKQLLRQISPEYRQHINVVRGIGGVGKTALVLEVAHQCWVAKENVNNLHDIPTFDAIIFTSSKTKDLVGNLILNRPEKEPSLIDIFRVISDVLNEPTITKVSAEKQYQKVNEALSRQSTLLIVDSMETLLEDERNAILSFLSNVPISTQVIITTRGYIGFDGISIASLTKTESYQLLARQAEQKNIRINNNWKNQVYERFGGIPIALIYAVGMLSAGYQLTDIIEPNKFLTQDLGKFCFESSIRTIKESAAYQVLLSMSFFIDSPCRDALINAAGLVDGNQKTIDAVVKLQQLSLITEETTGRYSILSITRQYTILELGADLNLDFKNSARERWYNWYLGFTQRYGGYDWEGWRTKYDLLDLEWGNIRAVLHWYAGREEWRKVLQIWENVDNYADLSGYWQDRRYWWSLLERNTGDRSVRCKALSENGFTLMLMGTEYYQEAKQYLERAWDIRKDVDKIVQSTMANHLALLAKIEGDYDRAKEWLSIEEELLIEHQDTKEKKRCQIRNLYYHAEIDYLENRLDIAKDKLLQTIELTREIGWQRFRNYAKNILAEIYIKQGDLESAQVSLQAGLSSAIQSKERRRIALYNASYARFYYQLAQESKQEQSIEKTSEHTRKAHDSATKALRIFQREFMVAEQQDITNLLILIENYLQ